MKDKELEELRQELSNAIRQYQESIYCKHYLLNDYFISHPQRYFIRADCRICREETPQEVHGQSVYYYGYGSTSPNSPPPHYRKCLMCGKKEEIPTEY